jgi:hypothetical protein
LSGERQSKQKRQEGQKEAKRTFCLFCPSCLFCFNPGLSRRKQRSLPRGSAFELRAHTAIQQLLRQDRMIVTKPKRFTSDLKNSAHFWKPLTHLPKNAIELQARPLRRDFFDLATRKTP